MQALLTLLIKVNPMPDSKSKLPGLCQVALASPLVGSAKLAIQTEIFDVSQQECSANALDIVDLEKSVISSQSCLVSCQAALASPLEGSVERAAKLEAVVMARVAQLRREGLWSASTLPLCAVPPRSKTHWDYLLEEMKWMAQVWSPRTKKPFRILLSVFHTFVLLDRGLYARASTDTSVRN